MTKTSGRGKVYASRNLTRHYLSGIGTAVMAVVGVAVVAVLLHPPLLTWWLS